MTAICSICGGPTGEPFHDSVCLSWTNRNVSLAITGITVITLVVGLIVLLVIT